MRTRPDILNGQSLEATRCRVFLDFDNTVTRFDVLDQLIQRFAVTDDWKPLERAWQAGTLGSQACMTGQLRWVRASRQELERYLTRVPLDPWFRRLLALLRRRGIAPVILSDSFDWLITRILRHHRLAGLSVYANHLRVADGRLIPSFPFVNGCLRCAHCKKAHVANSRAQGQTTIFIGDGLSDVCAAEVADVVFAKSRLRRHLQRAGRPHIPFRNLHDVYTVLQRSFQ